MSLEVKRVEQIIEAEQHLHCGQKIPDIEGTILLLQEHLETIRQAEVDRVRGRLGRLSREQELAIEALTQGIISNIMNTPIDTLKTIARGSNNVRSRFESTTIIRIVERLFSLQG